MRTRSHRRTTPLTATTPIVAGGGENAIVPSFVKPSVESPNVWPVVSGPRPGPESPSTVQRPLAVSKYSQRRVKPVDAAAGGGLTFEFALAGFVSPTVRLTDVRGAWKA